MPRNVRSTSQRFERLEHRHLMAAAPMEIYAMEIVNLMRQDPPAFADVLDQMRSNQAGEGHGFANTDPVWQDLREAIEIGFMPSNVPAALELLRGTDPLPPLTWEDSLYAESSNHNNWMQTTCFAHSTPENSSASGCLGQLPGLTYNPSRAASQPDYIGDSTLGEWSSGAFNENIGYQSGPTMPHTRDAYQVGSDDHRQRQAYYDIVSFVLEFNSGSLGHLEALLHPRRDAIGIAYATLDGFSIFSSDTNFLATHTLSRNASVGAYLTGIAYDDTDNNGLFDLGEQSSGCISVTPVNSSTTTQYCSSDDEVGLLSQFLPVGDYWIDGGVTRKLIQLVYQSQNQNIDVSAMLKQESLFDVGYAAVQPELVSGTHTIPAGTGYVTMMIVAETDATIQIEYDAGLNDQVWITTPDRIEVGSRDGNQVNATLEAGAQYVVIAGSIDQASQLHITTTGSVNSQLTNLFDSADVDQSGTATPIDALVVINQLAIQFGSDLPLTSRYYLDTNGDGVLTPRDALFVLNAIAIRQSESTSSIQVAESEMDSSQSIQSFSATNKSTREQMIDHWMTDLGTLF
ncbi:dockerin type I domain-containing protein [Stieleria sp. JC731]|uniref:dockerin type I domain-containing protein n=1 Tax=Pirellulaceae TaxID=2691357 RepID=UPI001E479767|nr:dockerin type I domain-containing protein [Stieleria sp. JC731]MCC9600147.1 dockerin type I domain-containing protein [Stieleria sp. JC731]